MKTLVLIALLAASAIGVRAGDLWQWAPNNRSYTDNHGRSWSGFQWAPGHTTWTEHHVTFVLSTKGATSDQNVPAD